MLGMVSPLRMFLNTHYILERQVNRKAKLWPFKSVLGAQPTWQAQGYKCLCRNTRENQQKVQMPLLLVADGCRQQLTRGFAVHDSFFAISGAASLTPSVPMFASLKRNGNPKCLLWHLLCACFGHHVPLWKMGIFWGSGEKLIAWHASRRKGTMLIWWI